MREETRNRLGISEAKLADFCQSWQIAELSLFGSILRDDFGPDSDIDLLVRYEADAHWSLIDHIGIENELAAIMGRKVDLVSKPAVEKSHNWIRRRNILDSAELVYESRP